MINDTLGQKNLKNFSTAGTEIAAPDSPDAPPPVARMVEDIVGCKWSLTILGLIRQGSRRPGLIERSVEGLTTKVMNERLSKLVRYNILLRTSYPEIPPRVEYDLTEFGEQFTRILDAIAELERHNGKASGKMSQSAHHS